METLVSLQTQRVGNTYSMVRRLIEIGHAERRALLGQLKICTCGLKNSSIVLPRYNYLLAFN